MKSIALEYHDNRTGISHAYDPMYFLRVKGKSYKTFEYRQCDEHGNIIDDTTVWKHDSKYKGILIVC